MPKRSSSRSSSTRPISSRPSRKSRKQLWIGSLAGSILVSGLLFGNAIDAHLLAVAAQNTRSFDEGWIPFQDHLERLSSRSAWLGLAFLVFFGFALPRAYRVARRYFPRVKAFQAKWAISLLVLLFLLGGATGFFGGSLVDRMLTGTDIVH